MKSFLLLIIIVLIVVSFLLSKKLNSEADLLIPREGLPFLVVGFTMAAGQFGGSSLVGGVQLASEYSVGEGFYAGAYALIGGAISCFINVFIGPAVKRHAKGSLTPSDFMRRRYGRCVPVQAFHSIAYLLSLTCVLVSQFVSFANMASAVGFRYEMGIMLCAVAVCLLALGSGLIGVAYTDMIQYAIIVILLPATAFFSIRKLGTIGITVPILMQEPFFATKAHWNKFMYILWPYVFGNMFNYEYFMRYQSCRSEREARKACITAGILLLVIALPVALMGAIANYCYNGQDTSTVFQQILSNDLPMICRYALMLVVLLAILTTADSFCASISAIASKDLYGNLFHKGKNINELPYTRLIARASMIAACAVAAVLALKFTEILSIIFAFAPLTTGVFWSQIIIGMFWKKASKKGMTCSVALSIITAILHMTGIIQLFDRLVGVICVSAVSLVVFSLLLPDKKCD